jgi:hypothetical protein
MLEYEALKHLFQFLRVLENNKKHWSDNFSWTMLEFMHQEVMKATKATMGVVQYVVLNCEEMSIVDNHYWLWCRIGQGFQFSFL